MTIIRFPPRSVRAVLICRERSDGGWLVLTPRGFGWLCGSLAEARAEARWLARNLDLPVREISQV